MYGFRNRRESGEELSDMDSEPATPTRGRRRSAETEAGDKNGQKKKKRPVVRPAKAREIVNPLDTPKDTTEIIHSPRQKEVAKASVQKEIPATKPKDQSEKGDPSTSKEKAKERPSEIPTATEKHLNSSIDTTTSSDDSEDSLTSVE